MERRSFLRLLCAGVGTLSVATSAKALDMVMPLNAGERDVAETPAPSVATPKDMDGVQIEKAWYGHWRRVNRRVTRRVYRRHYYYHHPYYY
jgi:hypothetical protein